MAFMIFSLVASLPLIIRSWTCSSVMLLGGVTSSIFPQEESIEMIPMTVPAINMFFFMIVSI